MHAAELEVTPRSLLAHMSPQTLEHTSRALSEDEAKETQDYLDALTDRQKRDLSGVADRLAIVAESEVGPRLDPARCATKLDIRSAVRERAVVYFRLDSDRRPLLAQMIAASIISDLVSLVSVQQENPVPTVVMIDEFSAVAAENVSRLFGRARSAGISLILAAQELTDLKAVGDGVLREQTLGNVAALIAHRQNVPESTDLIAGIAGTHEVWVTSQQTERTWLGTSLARRGNRKRGREFWVHPDRVKQLQTGEALVVTPGWTHPRLARIHYSSTRGHDGRYVAHV
jgi:type IV secretory pathway TraG/TraD family ATPase VirD4